jgi:uncharacterized phage protein (TIGR02220 family)
VKYRKVSPVIWQDERFRTFTDDGKLAFRFLLTHPAMTSVGAMRGTVAGLAAELGWPPRRLARALAPALDAAMVEINADAAFVALPRFLRHNPPDNPNVAKAWVTVIGEYLPECPERTALVERRRATLDGAFLTAFDQVFAEAFPKGLPEPFAEPLGEPSANGMPIQGTRSKEQGTTPQPPSGEFAWLDLLNRQAGTQFKPTDANLRPIRARLREGHCLADAQTVVAAKVAKWSGTEMAEYLRPSTLFGPKFDGYLQACRNGHAPVDDEEDV